MTMGKLVVVANIALLDVGAFAVQGDGVVADVSGLIAGLTENWRGLAVVMVLLMAGFIGPLVYVFKRMMDFQEREGQANRDMQREVSKNSSEAIDKVAQAVMHLDLTIRAGRRVMDAMGSAD